MSTTPLDSNTRAQAQLIHAVSLCAVVLCPVVLALPPRKLDVYSVLLVSGTLVGGNQLAREYTGRSIVKRIQEVPAGVRARMEGEGGMEREGRVLGEVKRRREGVVAGEKSRWKLERDKKEKEALEEGKGYGDLITEQIWEVWNWGREKADGGTKVDVEKKDGKR